MSNDIRGLAFGGWGNFQATGFPVALYIARATIYEFEAKSGLEEKEDGMVDYQFYEDTIIIQPFAAAKGPYKFDLTPALPEGDAIASVAVKSYLEDVNTTTDLIESSSESAGVVSVYLDYPTGKLGNHKLVFEYTLDSGAKGEAAFYSVLAGVA